jgi:Flp pilus assembly protein protease CpaA
MPRCNGMNVQVIFDLLKLAPVAAILFVAAKQDRKHGEVKNKLWLYAPIGLTLSLIEYAIIYPPLLLMATISATLAITLSLGVFYVGGWGGADSKALITVGVSAPLTPVIFGANMLPLSLLWVSSLVAIVYSLAAHKKTIRFMPCFFVGFIVACII